MIPTISAVTGVYESSIVVVHIQYLGPITSAWSTVCSVLGGSTNACKEA